MSSIVEAARLSRRELRMLGQNVVAAVKHDGEASTDLDWPSDKSHETSVSFASAIDPPSRPAA